MGAVIVNIPAGLELAVQKTPEEFEVQIRLMAALKMFELGKLSSGKAAELAGLSRVEFFEMCGRYKVSIFNYDDDMAEQEVAADVEALKRQPE